MHRTLRRALSALTGPLQCVLLAAGVVKLTADGLKVTQQTPLKLRKECMEEEISFKCEVCGASSTPRARLLRLSCVTFRMRCFRSCRLAAPPLYR